MNKKTKAPLVPKIDIEEELKIESVKDDSVIEAPLIEKKNSLLFMAGSGLSLIMVLGVVLLGWVYFNQGQEKVTKNELLPTPTEIVVETKVTETLEKEKIVFEVFNATKKSGEAKKYQEKLEKLGFKVDKIGNESKAIKGMVLLIPKELEPKRALILEEIKKEIPTIVDGGENKDSTKLKLIIGENN